MQLGQKLCRKCVIGVVIIRLAYTFHSIVGDCLQRHGPFCNFVMSRHLGASLALMMTSVEDEANYTLLA